MTRVEPLIAPLAIISMLLCGCSSKPADPEKSAGPAAMPSAQTTSRFDFGAVELSPATGHGKEATFEVTVKRGSQKPSMLGVLINGRPNGENACYVFRNLVNSSNMLVADSGTGGLQLGTQKSVANSQCAILLDGTDSTENAAGITSSFHIRFQPAFRGLKHIWVMPTDPIGNGPELKQLGDWTVE